MIKIQMLINEYHLSNRGGVSELGNIVEFFDQGSEVVDSLIKDYHRVVKSMFGKEEQ